MEIKETAKYCIIMQISPKLGNREVSRLSSEIRKYKTPIAIDMSLVKDCTIEFINLIKDITNLSLFNINSDIFALLISMNLDKTLQLFVSENDFQNNKHQLLNRKFCIV